MKSKIWMYITSGMIGGTLAVLAQYCEVPWYGRYPVYFLMGMIIAIAWKHNNERNNNERSD